MNQMLKILSFCVVFLACTSAFAWYGVGVTAVKPVAVESEPLFDVALPYEGPGSVCLLGNDGEIVIIFGDMFTGEVDGVKFSLSGFEGQDELWADGWLELSLNRDGTLEISVSALDLGDAVQYLGFSAPARRLAQQPVQPAEPSLQECPGGYCSCSGPHGPASACCPAGKSPVCRCTAQGSSGVCVTDKVQKVEVQLDIAQMALIGVALNQTPALAELGEALNLADITVEEVFTAGFAAEKRGLFPVDLPYDGPGAILAYDGMAIINFGEMVDDCDQYEAVAFKLVYAPQDFALIGWLTADVDDGGNLFLAVDGVEVTAEMGITGLGLASGMSGSQMQQVQEPAAQPACPGGSCSCSGPQGPASACCPEGKSAVCICNKDVSSGRCVKDSVAEAMLSFELAEATLARFLLQ